MTRREKILLQICIAIGLIGLSSIYLLKPAMKDKEQKQVELEAVQLQEIQIQTILDQPDVEKTYEEQKALAKQNYQYFYDKLNSYTIDGILNELVAECGMDVYTLNIGDYVEVDKTTLQRNMDSVNTADSAEETVEGEEETAQEEETQLLLGCNVTLTVDGTYEQVLALMDALKKESTCIEVSALSLYKDERNTEKDEAIQATLGLLVYGISDAGLEGEDS